MGCRRIRRLIADRHQAEPVRGVRAPVVIGAQANVAGFVFALMIVAECIEATLDGWRLREPTEREHPSRGLDTHHGRASALVRNWLGTVKARIPPMVHVALAGDGVGVSA